MMSVPVKSDVAIKVLPGSVAADADRLARFQREAEVLASLNHPNIAQIHGLERSDDTTALIMELVDGPTLADRIAQGPIPADEALGIAMQIADALEAAHEQDIVHRDLKPANIKLRPDGTVKVLDFGIAKALETQRGTTGPQTPSLTTPAMTQAGILLGTAAYMSPEQARGKAVDQRADIWAFGCVLYEMLTGQPAFAGEDVPTTLARVLANNADFATLPGRISPDVRQTIKLCLQKDVRNRVRDIGDVKLALKGAFETGPQNVADKEAVARPLWRRALPFSAALIVIVLLASALIWSLTRPAPSAPAPVMSRFVIAPPETAPLANLGGYDIAISPDGKRLAYFAQDPQKGGVRLYVRDLDGLEARAVPGTEIPQPEQGDMNPFFSPDGQWIGFRSPGQGVMRISINGEPPLKMIDDPGASGRPFLGATWASDDTLIYADGNKLYRVSAHGGGTPKQITPDMPGYHTGPVLLPGGRAVLFNVVGNSEQVAVLDLETGKQRILLENATQASYAPTGHIVFIRGATLMAVPFDVDRLTVTGQPVALLQGIRHPNPLTAADYALSDTGTLVYVPGGAQSAESALVWVDRDGRVAGRAVSDLIDDPRDPQLSPDGRRVVLTTGPFGDGDLWVYDLGGRPPIPLASKGDDRFGAWSPDGRRIAFLSTRDNKPDLYIAPADGSVLDPMPLRPGALAGAQDDQSFASTHDRGLSPEVWSAKNELILLRLGKNADIVATSADGKGDMREVEVTPDDEWDPALSPNGRWLAYASTRTGRGEVWVKGYPDGIPMRISQNSGSEPVWSRDGQELFYREGGNTIMSVPVKTEGKFSFDAAVKLFTGTAYSFAVDGRSRSYDVARDGRFLMIEPSANSADAGQASHIVVVQNWFEELKRKVPSH